MLALVTVAAAINVVLPPVVAPLTAARTAAGGLIATDVEGFYGQGVQAVTTASSLPCYHTTEDTNDKINLSDLERATSYITQLTRTVQQAPPESIDFQEVPAAEVSAPKTAAPGAAVPVETTLTAVGLVRAHGGLQDVVAVAAGERVVAARAAQELVVAHAAGHPVVLVAAVDRVVARVLVIVSAPLPPKTVALSGALIVTESAPSPTSTRSAALPAGGQSASTMKPL